MVEGLGLWVVDHILTVATTVADSCVAFRGSGDSDKYRIIPRMGFNVDRGLASVIDGLYTDCLFRVPNVGLNMDVVCPLACATMD